MRGHLLLGVDTLELQPKHLLEAKAKMKCDSMDGVNIAKKRMKVEWCRPELRCLSLSE
jgi:hypothetical protein